MSTPLHSVVDSQQPLSIRSSYIYKTRTVTKTHISLLSKINSGYTE